VVGEKKGVQRRSQTDSMLRPFEFGRGNVGLQTLNAGGGLRWFGSLNTTRSSGSVISLEKPELAIGRGEEIRSCALRSFGKGKRGVQRYSVTKKETDTGLGGRTPLAGPALGNGEGGVLSVFSRHLADKRVGEWGN